MFTDKMLTFRSRFFITALAMLLSTAVWARVGGAGGHHSSGSHSSGSHSSGSYSSHSSGGSYGHSYSNDGGTEGSGSSTPVFILLIFIFVVVVIIKNKQKNNGNSGSDDEPIPMPVQHGIPFPEGLTKEKVYTAFMELQKAWQVQDIRRVRRWMSDGVYQRFTAQFSMMKKLSQYNELSNIQVLAIVPVAVKEDGAYQSVDVAISFQMDDSFVSDTYPQLNEAYEGEQAMEYWTFIKRGDANATQNDLYHADNCPNCGTALDDKMGEVSRCPSCKTLVNNASYDWVLSEITQEADYKATAQPDNSERLVELTKNDNLFSIQRMEDIASNVFMQIMEVVTGADNRKLSRFAAPALANEIAGIKSRSGSFVFDRLYLNEVTLIRLEEEGDTASLLFRLTATYQRVRQGKGDSLTDLDADMNTHPFFMTLSRKKDSLGKPSKEISFSHECASCGAPYDDTTTDFCGYCDAPVLDVARNWVVTDFKGLTPA